MKRVPGLTDAQRIELQREQVALATKQAEAQFGDNREYAATQAGDNRVHLRNSDAAAVSRKIRMLPAHGILHKVSHTHPSHAASGARTMIVAILTSAQTSLQQINTIRGKAA